MIGVIEIVEVGSYALFEAMSIILCLHYLYGEKFRFEKISVYYLIIDVALMVIVYLLHVKSMWTLIIFPVIFIYSGFKFGFKWKSLIINNVLLAMILTILQISIMMVYSILLNDNKMREFDAVIVNAVMFLLVFYGLKRCRLNKLSNTLQYNEKIVGISLAVAIITIGIFFINYKQKQRIEILYYVVLGICVLLIIITAIDIGKSKIKVKETEAELRLHKLYESSFKDLIDEICARQHEFDNHINTIYSQHHLYKTYNELVEVQKQYCDAILSENHYNKLLSKGNPVILCFLYSQFLEIEKENIDILYQINIGNMECGMPVHKMVELLRNLIKNAVEAIQIRGNGKLKVEITEENERIQIEVANENEIVEEKKIKDFFKKGYSEKGSNSGYGLYNVGRICEEYRAVLFCKNEETEGTNWLVFRVIIGKPL